jgi:hypothetical protein
MVPTDPATDWIKTFSTGVNGNLSVFATTLKYANPMSAEGMAIPLTQPVCNPKYILEKQMTIPIAEPTKTPRSVKFCGCDARSAR